MIIKLVEALAKPPSWNGGRGLPPSSSRKNAQFQRWRVAGLRDRRGFARASVYQDISLGAAWRQHFKDFAEVTICHGNICRVACDAIVSPANSFGFMDGGLDLALSERFGWNVQDLLQKAIRRQPLGELLVGQALIVPTGDTAIPWLISAPTMRVPMRLRQSVNVYLAMKAIFEAVRSHVRKPAIETVAVPGLGTGCGGLSPETAARQMAQAIRDMSETRNVYPESFAEAQKRHVQLNPEEINLWDA